MDASRLLRLSALRLCGSCARISTLLFRGFAGLPPFRFSVESACDGAIGLGHQTYAVWEYDTVCFTGNCYAVCSLNLIILQ